jgi:GTPase KRas
LIQGILFFKKKSYNPTIEDTFQKKIELNNEIILVDLLDTAGQEEFEVMRDSKNF